ncbi:ABC transporter substrate-binding protein [Streptomyces fuscigenes]|uniref:ABC transporter substrate-binding protein n=1 Tax=Streptomyces fuscigenes TaxID=1528880 RepID=UPI001F16437D|nr:ABC transporter substrate-binding protein [Streptomyces fuscigenes]MCF3964414.1 ABC transporter substrate-binding protein [Streptomyces fuscigenes]
MKHKTLVLSAAVGLLAPVLAGCGGSGDSSDAGKAIVVGTTDQFVATKAAPAPFDPAYTYDTSAWNVLHQTIQTLTHVPRGGGEPVPEAANRCLFTDHQSQTYRCTLRPDLKFANGDPVTAEDVKYSIERVVNIHDPNSAYGLLTNIGKIDTSGRTVEFHLKSPDATFPYKLATPAAGIVDPKQYAPKKLRDGFQIDGSGPYVFKAKVENNTLVGATFTKNPNYIGDVKIKNDKVQMDMFKDASAMSAAFDKDDVDVMLRMTPDQIKDLTDNPRKDVNLTEMPGLEIRYLGFDTDSPVAKNKAVRQAMAYVVDRDALVDKVYGATATPLYSLIPAGITGHTNSFFNQYGAQPSVKSAASTLEKAGVHTPVKLTLNYTTDHYGAPTAKEFETLRSQLDDSKLFDVTIKGTPWDTFRPDQTKGDYAIYGMGWFPDFPDPDNFTAPFLDKDNFLGSPYDNPKIRNEWIPESRRKADRGSAAEVFGDIQNQVAADVPILPLWQGKQYVAAHTDVTGVEWAVDSATNYYLWELGRGSSTN